MLKYAFSLLDEGLVGQQMFAGESTRLAHVTDEVQAGRDQFVEKREPDWYPYPVPLVRRFCSDQTTVRASCVARIAIENRGRLVRATPTIGA